MVIDSSAIAAIFFHEPERTQFVKQIEDAADLYISAATLLEINIVIRRELGDDGVDRLSKFIDLFEVEIVGFDHQQFEIANRAFRDFGKGMNSRAKLNLGDLFSYALAKNLNEPLLFKGDDFVWTDIVRA